MSQRNDGTQQPNRLLHESSLYLQQHAYNPVDWYPWGEEALAKAKADDKPIIVSIGYSSCHWCHVMEKESFEDPDVAAFQNEHFVSIKVDREERPDVDRVYMAACQLLNQSGGWPLNAFLLPDGRPFFAGTYFPPQDRYGRPSWRSLLKRIQGIFSDRRDELEEDASQLTEMIAAGERKGSGDALPDKAALDAATTRLLQKMDPVNGGFGKAPKFPNVMALELLALDVVRRSRPKSEELLRRTLDRMADGGIYDHLGGGFHRYSVDESWAVPHFEKMLYDNGLLLRLYTEGYRLTKDDRYREVIEEIATYISREMTAPEGAFYASQDADSEGEEGRFFVWTPTQLTELLGEELGQLMARWYGVTEEGNFEETGATVLARHIPLTTLAGERETSVASLCEQVAKGKHLLWQTREERIKPARDEKRITSWNALVIQGLARAALQLNHDEMRRQADAAGKWYLQQLNDDEKLFRIYAQHPEAQQPSWSVPGFLDDHAFLALAFIDLYQATGHIEYLRGAHKLVDVMLERFYVETDEGGVFQFCAKDAEALIVQTRSAVDEAIPGAMSAAMLACQRIGLSTAEHRYTEKALEVLSAYQKEMIRYPNGFSSLVQGLDAYHYGQKAIVAIVPAHKADTSHEGELRAAMAQYALPCDQIHIQTEGTTLPEPFAHLSADKSTKDGLTTFYVCNDQSCSAPVTERDDIPKAIAQLDGVEG